MKKKGNERKYPVSPGGRATPFTKGEIPRQTFGLPPLLQKGKGIILSQESRKKVANVMYDNSRERKKMSEKKEKKNAIADGEMAASIKGRASSAATAATGGRG